ncbi:MAG: fatty acid desaturase [Gammaproteobacteria bacterium]|nr:fatty acid desaturase [Gammaproteobacteria bacterium]
MRTGQDLIKATVPFTEASTRASWWHVGSTFALLAGALTGAAVLAWWPLRLLCSLLAALLMMRTFITFHDFMHRAILVRSRVARLLFSAYSALSLTPPRSWKKSHNYHHGHVGQISSVSVGAFPMMTTAMWRKASRIERMNYRVIRHPLTLLAGYFTIFFLNVTLLPFLKDPKHHWDSLLALVGHAALITTLWLLGGFSTVFFVVLLPMTIASALGSYLFYAQHSFKDMHILQGDEWSYAEAAMESSSYLQLNKLMQWFTGNIGFHHIHHLNVRIPFYRLPEAMAAIPELQSPVTTTLKPRDILDCLRCSLWDENRQRVVSFREA